MTTLDDKAARELARPEGKADFIHFDDALKGFGVRVRPGADGRPLRSWVVRYRATRQQKRLKLSDVTKLNAKQARERAKVGYQIIWKFS